MSTIFISGQEDYLVRKKITECKEGVCDLDVTELNSSDDNEIVSSCSTYPMFGDKRVVVCTGDLFKGEHKLLEGYIKNPCNTTTLVIVSPDCDKRKSLYKVIDKHGKTFFFDKLKDAHYTNFIRGTLTSLGCRYEDNIPEYIAEVSGYLLSEEARLGEVVSSLEKMKDFANGEIINQSMVDRLIKPFVDTNIYRLIDHISHERFDEAMSQLVGMLQSVNSIQILTIILWHFRLLYRYRIVSDKSKLVLAPFQYKKLQAISGWPEEKVEKAIVIVGAAVDSIKSGFREGKASCEFCLAELSML